jgi:hypothetical protein
LKIENASLSVVRSLLTQDLSGSTAVAMSLSTPAANYQSVFESAVETYRKTTKNDLASHPLLTKLESCHSPEAILTALRGQILWSDLAQSSNDKSTTWLGSTVKVLFAFSSTISGVVGLVSLADSFTILTLMFILTDIPTHGGHFYRDWHPSFCQRSPFVGVGYHNTQVSFRQLRALAPTTTFL